MSDCPDCGRPYGFEGPHECSDPGNAPCLRAQLAAALARAKAAEAKLADVETLDEWAIGGRRWNNWRAPRFAIVAVQLMGEGHKFDADTPALARAAAAKWVRSLINPEPGAKGGGGGQ